MQERYGIPSAAERVEQVRANSSLPDGVKGPISDGTPRNSAENRQARDFYKNNKALAREWYEEREGRLWPTVDGEALPGEHGGGPGALREGADPLRVRPGNIDANAEHMIPREDGRTDQQIWGSLGSAQRELNRRLRREIEELYRWF
jgi:hypothetical protein